MLTSIRFNLMEPSLVNGQIKAGPCGCALRSLDLAIACGYPCPIKTNCLKPSNIMNRKKPGPFSGFGGNGLEIFDELGAVMGNFCTVDMRLRTPKTNVKGLTQALHYLLYSGGMMPNAENLRDYVQVLKQIQGDCRVYLQQLRCIHTNWISFGQMEVVADEDNWVVQLFGNCHHSVSSAFVFEGGEDYSQLCRECGVDFSIASEEPGCDFVEEFNFINGQMQSHVVYDWSAYVKQQLNEKWDALDQDHIQQVVEDELEDDFIGEISKEMKIELLLESGINPDTFGINAMNQAQRCF